MSNDWIERTRDAVLGNIASQATAGTPVYSQFIDPNVTATNANPIIIFDGSAAAVGGIVSSHNLALVGEPEPWLETIVPGYSRSVPCDGPGCQKEYDGSLWPPKRWLKVSNRDGNLGEFCSLRCLANWLAGELAKEESNGNQQQERG